MKANAPEKIYIDDFGSELSRDWHTEHSYEKDIEYTRTNAFIEKSFEFFSEHLWEYIDAKNANCDTFINIDGDKLKEDFRNYIKGE